MAPQPALHERLGTRQGCLDLNRQSVAVLKSMGRHLEQAGCRGAAIERLADGQQLGWLEPVGVRRSGPGRDHLHQLGGPTCRSPPGIDKQHLLQLGQLRSQLGGELLHAAASHLFGQQRPNPVVTAQAVADAELLELRERGGRVVTSSFHYHLARLIEILAALEAIELLLNDPEICATHVRAHAGVNAFEAVGVSEAPRGTLFHHYRVDANGLIEAVNLIIATGQNNRAMNRTVTQIASQWIPPGATEISEGLLNRVEAGIRCFDPCLSCSTHAAGQMPLHVQLIGPNGEMLQERWRQ